MRFADNTAALRRGPPPRRFRTRLGTALVLVGVAVTILATAAADARTRVRAHLATRACADANSPVTSVSGQEMRAAVVCLVNRQRTARHLPSIRENGRLERAAQAWTNAMVARHEFTEGSDFSTRVIAVGFNFSALGENIATGFATPRAVVSAWMASTGHCRNILNPSYDVVGTGVNRHAISGATRGGATWTQDFGLGLDQRPPSENWRPADGCPY
jgi:uncharacterized protein YkwD